jgi:hypothetical protein
MPRTVHKTFRVTKFHDLMLESQPYKENKGVLVRLLLDEYFNGKLPTVQIAFKETLIKKMQKTKEAEEL